MTEPRLIGAILKLKGEFYVIRGRDRTGDQYKYLIQYTHCKGQEDETNGENFAWFSEEKIRELEG